MIESHGDFAFVILFAVATAVAIGARWLRVPYTVALLIAGLLLGATHAVTVPHLTKQLLFAVILPGLIFEAAFHLDASRYWRERVAIHSLAVPGLVIAIGITAFILTPVVNALDFVEHFSLIHGFVFAAIIAATDPIAVVGLFKSIGAPRRLALLVEGESLVNDGTGIVVFSVVVGFAAGRSPTVAHVVLDFFRVVGIGALAGIAVGYGISQVIRRVEDPMVELTLTIVAAYGSFGVAERFGGSGVIATLIAGMLCGNYAARVGMSPTTRVAVETAWEYAAFALNSVVFLLMGLEVHLDALLQAWRPILVAYAAVMVGRAVIVAGVTALLRAPGKRIPWAWSAIITWSGLRGALSMVLALGLAADFPNRTLLVNLTFGVVVLSILLQGLTMSQVLRRLGVVTGRSDERRAHEEQAATVAATDGAMAELERIRTQHALAPNVVDELRAEYEERRRRAEQELRELHARHGGLREQEERAARRRLILAERDAVQHAARHGLLGEEALARALADIDQRLRALAESE